MYPTLDNLVHHILRSGHSVANRQPTLLQTKLESIDAAVDHIDDADEDATCTLIASLTKSSDHHNEAVKCLQERYDRPRQIHQTHVRRIVD